MRFFSLFLLFVFMGQIFAQDICYQSLVEKSFLINFEGRFINSEKSRSHIDVSWRHHEQAPDSFYVYLSGKRSFLFISTNDYRVLWIQPENVKRQMATHHLKEKIGNTPIHWDDLDLLANGSFFCQDSSAKANFILATAYSQTWYSLVLNSETSPTKIRMRGNRGLSRDVTIHSWKNFNDALLPAILDINSPESTGSLWIRSAYPIESKIPMDPLLKNVQSKNGRINSLLLPRTERKRKMPLILQMDKELLQ
jgi:hypothetical protein